MSTLIPPEPAGSLPIPPGATASEFRTLILKLRWIGMEDEADRLIGVACQFDKMKLPLIDARETD